MALTNQELVNFNIALNKLGAMQGVKFAFAVAKNVSRIKTELESLDKAFETSEKYKEYDNTRQELAKKYAKKDEKGETIVNAGQFEMDDIEGFNSEFEPLKEKYKEEIDIRDIQIKEYLELLKQESKVEIFKVFIDNIPKEITVQQMYDIQPMVSELEIL